MSVSIVEILAGDKGIDLQNGYWARQPSILGNWNTIRIGARFHVPQASNANLTSTPLLRFGMCAGTTNAPGRVVNANVDNSLGWVTGGGFSGTFGWASVSQLEHQGEIQLFEENGSSEPHLYHLAIDR